MRSLFSYNEWEEDHAMTTFDKSLVKNAPLLSTEDRNDFVEWAISIPDGSISAGRQSLHSHLEREEMRAMEDQGAGDAASAKLAGSGEPDRG